MKLGALWKLGGLRKQPRGSHETARAADVSLGEWLNSVVKSDADDGVAAEIRSRPSAPEEDPNRDRIGREAAPARHEGRPYRSERPSLSEERTVARDNDSRPQVNRDAVRESNREAARRPEATGEPDRDVTVHEADGDETRREAARARQGMGEVHARLDGLAEQLERLSRLEFARRSATSTGLGVADEPKARSIDGAPPQRRITQEAVLSIDEAVAEIAARQRALDSETSVSAAMPEPVPPLAPADAEPPATAGLPSPAQVDEPPEPAAAPAREAVPDSEIAAPVAPAERALEFSDLEVQLRRITARIEALQPTSDFRETIPAVRNDLAEIGRQLNEALPRRAMEALEIEVRALGERLDDSRQCGVDPETLAGLERGLAEIREALRALTPAENLVGFGEAVNALSQKLDVILARDDPSALQQVEAAVGDLRDVISHVASNDTLARVAEEVEALASRVDSIADSVATGPVSSVLEERLDTLASHLDRLASNNETERAFSALEQRMDTLVEALAASSESGHAVPRDLETLLGGLIEKLEWVQLTHTDHAALAHLEDRIAMVVQRFDAADARFSHLEAIERGLADLLVHIEEMRSANAAFPIATLARSPAPGLERGVVEARPSERRTEDSLEAVQNSLNSLGDRLATIESGLRFDSLARAVPSAAGTSTSSIGAREAGPTSSVTAPLREPTPAAATRTPIDPTLPPHHPLEPGSTAGRSRPVSAADRIAASEAINASAKPPVIADSERPDFIAAARRAAQAAAWEPEQNVKPEEGAGDASKPNKLSQRLRKLIVAGGVVFVLVGGFRIATRLYDGGSDAARQLQSEPISPPTVSPQNSVAPKQPASQTLASPLPTPTTATPPRTEPATKVEQPGRQSMIDRGNHESAAEAAAQPTVKSSSATAMPLWASPDITGALPNSQSAPNIASAMIPGAADAQDNLPATIGDAGLRKAALAGNPAAAYEVAMRFFAGSGVLQNNVAAAHWLQRAVEQGLAPAQFRLGGFYENGIGVEKDLVRARDLYLAAAKQGNANAMHNLAVLYAEGVAGAPEYDKAVAWFQKAADHGIEDSQYNLGILYARGIGVARNEAESYKWFALAANQGDKEAAKKRDEVVSHLDAQSLATARLEVKNWAPQPQPNDAVNVNTAGL